MWREQACVFTRFFYTSTGSKKVHTDYRQAFLVTVYAHTIYSKINENDCLKTTKNLGAYFIGLKLNLHKTAALAIRKRRVQRSLRPSRSPYLCSQLAVALLRLAAIRSTSSQSASGASPGAPRFSRSTSIMEKSQDERQESMPVNTFVRPYCCSSSREICLNRGRCRQDIIGKDLFTICWP